MGRFRLKLKRNVKQKAVRHYDVEKLKDPTVSEQFELDLANRFAVLQPDSSVAEQWELFNTGMNDSTEAVLGRRQVPIKNGGYQTKINKRKMA